MATRLKILALFANICFCVFEYTNQYPGFQAKMVENNNSLLYNKSNYKNIFKDSVFLTKLSLAFDEIVKRRLLW